MRDGRSAAEGEGRQMRRRAGRGSRLRKKLGEETLVLVFFRLADWGLASSSGTFNAISASSFPLVLS
jgi:hypothetical protein